MPLTEATSARQLIALLGGAARIAWLLEALPLAEDAAPPPPGWQGPPSPAAVRQWSRRGYIPFNRLRQLEPHLSAAGVRYAGPTTRGLDGVRWA
jgi:hypothetical protein